VFANVRMWMKLSRGNPRRRNRRGKGRRRKRKVKSSALMMVMMVMRMMMMRNLRSLGSSFDGLESGVSDVMKLEFERVFSVRLLKTGGIKTTSTQRKTFRFNVCYLPTFEFLLEDLVGRRREDVT
jgi:hypothetical protein